MPRYNSDKPVVAKYNMTEESKPPRKLVGRAKAAKENAEYLKAKRMQQMAGKQMSPGENMAMGLAGMGQDSALQPAPTQPAAPTPQPTAPMGAMPAQKRGGRAGKK